MTMRRHKLTMRRPQTAAALGLALLLWPVVSAQTTQPAGPATVPYVEGSFGFEMQLPAGWTYDRTRFAAPGGALGLLRGRAVAQKAMLQVQILRSFEGAPFERWVERYLREVARSGGAKLLNQTPRPAGARNGVVAELEGGDAGAPTRTFYYLVEFDPTTIWVFSLGGAVPGPEALAPIRRQFDELAASLKVEFDPAAQEQIAAALERGKALLKRLGDLSRDLEYDGETRWYEITRGGRPAGYLTRALTRERRSLDDPRMGGNVKDGVHVQERTWSFADDGAATYLRVDLFASFDQQSEMMQHEQTVIPPAGAPVPLAVTTTDRVVREEQLLFSSVSTNLDMKLPDPREPIRVGAAYLGLAWTRLLPRILGDQPGETHAFAIYDSQTRALITHLIRALGPRPLPEGGSRQVLAFELREAFSAQPALLYTDERGHTLRFESGDVVIALSSQNVVDSRFAARRDDARKRAKFQLEDPRLPR